jgi:transposase
MKIKLRGVDLAKNVFQLCALNQADKVLFNRSIRRAKLRSSISQLEPTTIAMEACSSAHYRGRSFEAMGHKVLLVPAQHVTPFVRGGKSDVRDALSPVARHALNGQYQCLLETRQAMHTLLHQVEQLAAQHPAYDDLQVLPGVGPMIASAYIAAIGNGRQFKRGDRYLRSLMIHGARAIITRGLKTRPALAQWVQPIIDRQGFNKGVVALANKLTRILWVIVTTGEPFDMKQAFKPAV